MTAREREALRQMLARIRAEHGFATVTEMAEEWGLNQSHLNKLSTEHPSSSDRPPPGAGVQMLAKIREKSGYSIDTLLGYEVTGAHVVKGAQAWHAKTPEQLQRLDLAEARDRMKSGIQVKAAAVVPPKEGSGRRRDPRARLGRSAP